MDWWPTVGKLAGLEPPPREWKDNEGKPIIFDGIELSDSLLGTGPGKRDTFIYFNDMNFGGVRVKNFKSLYTAKDIRLGPELNLKIPAVYDLWWDPGEQYDIVFNGAAPTAGQLKRRPAAIRDRIMAGSAFTSRRSLISSGLSSNPSEHSLHPVRCGWFPEHPRRVSLGGFIRQRRPGWRSLPPFRRLVYSPTEQVSHQVPSLLPFIASVARLL